MARLGILTLGLITAAAVAATLTNPALAQTPEVTVTVPGEPTPNVSSGASKVVIPETKPQTKKVETPAPAAEVEKPAVVKKVAADKPKAKAAKPVADDVVTGGTPAAQSEVLPWAAPLPAAAVAPAVPDKTGKDKKAGDATKVVVTCAEQAEDGCRGLPKCAWVADIAQPDGSRTPARCAEKTVFTPPSKDKKKSQAAVSKPKPDTKPDTATGDAAKTLDVKSEGAESSTEPVKKSADAAKAPVTVSPPVEAVVKVPAQTVPAVVPPVKPQ